MNNINKYSEEIKYGGEMMKHPSVDDLLAMFSLNQIVIL